jgi:hypothetical protein
MPETRYNETYKDSVLVARTEYVVSDEQLELERAPTFDDPAEVVKLMKRLDSMEQRLAALEAAKTAR